MLNRPLANRTASRVFATLLVVIVLVAFWQVRSVLLLLLSSIILVVLVTTPMRFLQQRARLPRTPALLISLLIFPLFFLVLTLTVLPLLATQLATLSVRVNEGVLLLQQYWESLNATPAPFSGFRFAPPPVRDPVLDLVSLLGASFQVDSQLITQVANQIFNAFGQVGVQVIPVVGGVASALLNTLIVIFMSVYLLTDPESHESGLLRLFPPGYRERGHEILARLDQVLRGWLESTVLAMVFVWLSTWIGLTLLGLEEALALGVIAGLLAFVPTFGTLIAAVLAAVVGLLQTPQNVGLIIVITYAISLVQSQLISPLLVADRIKVPPIVVLLGQIVATVFFGFLGILLAVPLTAILMVLVQEVYVKDILGDIDQNRQLPVADVEALAGTK
ncbi:MAG: AI-2E family transporter [Anaerolineaceae bacterium]|nr:AI-2E family transporter [Anaerolineaceae bacterium]